MPPLVCQAPFQNFFSGCQILPVRVYCLYETRGRGLMKILVLSDSHGAMEPMEQAVERTQPRMIFHLGDCWRDAERLRGRFPQIPLQQVPGNCDFRSQEPAEQLLCMRLRILRVTGHLRRQASLTAAGLPPRRKTWICSSSATPTVPWWTGGEDRFLNPGSIVTGAPPYGLSPSPAESWSAASAC